MIHPDVVSSGEQKLIRYLARQLDQEVLRQKIRETYAVEAKEELSHKAGKIVAVDSSIAYRFDFDLRVSLSILMSRDGRLLGMHSPELKARKTQDKASPGKGLSGDAESARGKEMTEKAEKKAAEIARMLSEIND
jgi:hypothetical protein